MGLNARRLQHLMVTDMSNRSASMLVVICLLYSGATSAAENRGTLEQQEACTPDAFRLCGRYIPDPTKVQFCLRGSKPQLSTACRLIFEPAPRSRIVK